MKYLVFYTNGDKKRHQKTIQARTKRKATEQFSGLYPKANILRVALKLENC